VRARAESYAGRGRWGPSSSVRKTMGWLGKGWRRRAHAAAEEQRRAERKRKGTPPRRGSYVEDKGVAHMRRWRLHARCVERRWRDGRQRRREVAGGRPCHRDIGMLAWASAILDTRPWTGADGLVASAQISVGLYCAVDWARLHFVISMIFTHPKFEIQNGDLPDV
jgi:hypothetical protein